MGAGPSALPPPSAPALVGLTADPDHTGHTAAVRPSLLSCRGEETELRGVYRGSVGPALPTRRALTPGSLPLGPKPPQPHTFPLRPSPRACPGPGMVPGSLLLSQVTLKVSPASLVCHPSSPRVHSSLAPGTLAGRPSPGQALCSPLPAPQPSHLLPHPHPEALPCLPLCQDGSTATSSEQASRPNSQG